MTAAILGAGYLVFTSATTVSRTNVVAYFANSNGVFVGDDVRIRGFNVGTITAIEPEPTRVRISFWLDDRYKVPADATAAVLSPTLVSARAIQLTPPYVDGAALQDGAVIPESRTAVPMEFDDFREQLQRLTDTLQPTEPGGVSTLGGVINTTADNLRGQGPAIRDAILKLSETVSALGDHSGDTFTTLKNLNTLVSALQGSTDLIRQLNQNLASVSGLLADDPQEVSDAVQNFSAVIGDVQSFVMENREALGTTSDKLTSLSEALTDSLGDIKQVLHVGPNGLQNFVNIYQPAQGTASGILAANNFANPISFLCGAIQAASRLDAEESSKLCVQYLAPIVKNRQMNFLPLGINPFVGATARPNELTYSEDWMRPDFVPPLPSSATPPPATAGSGPLAAEAPMPVVPADGAQSSRTTEPSAGLAGLMTPPGGGS